MRKILRLIACFLLCAALWCSLLPAGLSLAEEAHVHDGITFLPWTDSTKLPASGSYYLTTDVIFPVSYMPENTSTLNLCLNGHVITSKKNVECQYYYVCGSQIVFNQYDCQDTPHYFTETAEGLWVLDEENGTRALRGGCITGLNDEYELGRGWGGVGGMLIHDGATFNMYGGNYVGNSSCYCAGVMVGFMYGSSSGTFNMYGGKIVGNASHFSRYPSGEELAGVGVHVEMGSTFNMYGGTIAENVVLDPYYDFPVGVYIWNGKMNVQGECYIVENYRVVNGVATERNVGFNSSFQKINLTGNLADSSKIGVTLTNVPTGSSTVTLTGGSAGTNLSHSFFSDQSKFAVGADAQNQVVFSVKSASCKPNAKLYYEAPGGYYAPFTETHEIGSTVRVNKQEPFRHGYTFWGWADDPDAAEPEYFPGDKLELDENSHTIYAIWKPLDIAASPDSIVQMQLAEPVTVTVGDENSLLTKDNFGGIDMDGVPLAETDYLLEDGDGTLKFSLSADLLNSLEEGGHSVTVHLKDVPETSKSLQTAFTVIPAPLEMTASREILPRREVTEPVTLTIGSTDNVLTKENFGGIDMNGTPLSETDYTLEDGDGSLRIILSSELLNRLEEGDYTFTANLLKVPLNSQTLQASLCVIQNLIDMTISRSRITRGEVKEPITLIIGGEGSTITKEHFDGMDIDGIPLSETDYTLVDDGGTLRILLSPELLNQLEGGSHTITVNLRDMPERYQAMSVGLFVDVPVPATGDAAPLALWMLFAAAALAGITLLLYGRGRRHS